MTVPPTGRRRLLIARLSIEFGMIMLVAGGALFAGVLGSLSTVPSGLLLPAVVVIAVMMSFGAVLATNGLTALLALHQPAATAATDGPATEHTWLMAPPRWRP